MSGLPLVLALLSGFLVVQAHNGPLPALALVALTPAWIALELLPPRAVMERAAVGALVYAVPPLHMLALLTWGADVLSGAATLLILSGAAFGALTAPLGAQPLLRRLGLIAAFTLSDAARGLSPLPFPALLGGTLADVPVVSAVGAVGGPWLAAAVCAGAGLAVADLLTTLARWQRPPRRVLIFWTGASALLGLALAAVLLSRPPLPPINAAPAATAPDAITITLLQTAVPEWAHREARQQPAMQRALDQLALDLLAAQARAPVTPDLITFAETPTGRILPPRAEDSPLLRPLLQPRPGEAPLPATPVLLSASQQRPPSPEAPSSATLEDAAFLLSSPPSPQIVWRGAKRQLTPLAEADYRPGPPVAPLQLPGGARIGVLFCFESLFPGRAAELSAQGAELLLVLSNDAGQGWSDGAAFHARLSRMRAIETGRPLLFVGQAGPSFAVDAWGRRVDLLGLFERGAATVAIPRRATPTLYASTGLAWPALAALLWLVAAAAGRPRIAGPRSGFLAFIFHRTPSKT